VASSGIEKTRSRLPRLRWIAATVALGVGLLAATFTLAWPQDVYEKLGLLSEVLTDIQKDYVTEVDFTRLMRNATVGMLTQLDGDNEVIDHRQAWDHRAGNGDVGLVVTRRKDDLTVVTSTDGSAARRAGLESGDQIVKIDGVETQTLGNSEAVDRLRGRSGTTVTLTVLRQGWAEPRDFTLTRERRDGPMLSSRDIGDGVLWVRVHRMTAGVGDALTRALAGSWRAGLVLDLRDVGGADVSDAVDLAQRFLDPGVEIAHTASRRGGPHQELRTSAAAAHLDIPTVVLVNAGTAGAAEIVAGALRDWQRAVLVGEHTFGAADVVKNIPLSDGSVVRLTVARYLTPKGKTIDHAGIAPDIEVASVGGPSTKDAQLERAAEVLKISRVIETRETEARAAQRGVPLQDLHQ